MNRSRKGAKAKSKQCVIAELPGRYDNWRVIIRDGELMIQSKSNTAYYRTRWVDYYRESAATAHFLCNWIKNLENRFGGIK